MRRALLAATALLFASGVAAAAPAAAPAPAADLQGLWTNASLTRLERDPRITRNLVMTPDEADKLERQTNDYVKTNNMPTDPKAGTEFLNTPCRANQKGPQCGYNAFWIDPGTTVMRVNGERRSSFITSEPDGRVPPLTPAGKAAVARQMATMRGPKAYDDPETRPLGERCIVSFGNSAGPVMLPVLYNNTYRIVETPSDIAIEVEMVHDVRHVRIASPGETLRHPPADVRLWMGDSIGRWENGELVIETTNFHPGQRFYGAAETLKVTERLKRVGPGRLHYSFWVEDPATFTKPWGGEYEFSQAKGPLYEYACQEGNYALHGILAGARQNERRGLPPGGDAGNASEGG